MNKNMNKINLINEIREDALTIGNEANLSRAIPYLRDGLKPSQRAVIFAAYDNGYTSNKPHVKSLKLDGNVVGSWWPHGSEYSTIVRLTQPFVMNLPLLDMHGSNGSQLGSADAAASRYTEVRLSEAAEDGFLSSIKKDTCEWIPNYSEDREWPKLFPAIIPNLFINGSSGMGYCYAQSWAPGNLNEFADKVKQYLKQGKISYDEIYPDFPTKGIIINKKDMPNIYKSGTGTIVLRGKAEIENNIIKITELPYQIYVTPYMEQLRKLVTPDAKGITKITGIDDIYNMSGDSGMLIEIECNENPEIILNKLYSYSDLQITVPVNQYAIIDDIPELVNLEKYIKTYVDHNIECIVREYTYDLDKATKRLEIVEGLINCIKMIDQVIDTIKKSKSSEAARENLQKQYKFTENQARAIVDMRLGKLANMESKELEDEQISLNKTIEACNKLLDSKSNQTKEFTKRLDAFVDKYGWERRTQLDDIDVVKEKSITRAATKIEEEFIIVLDNNHIKKIALANYKSKSTQNTIKVGAKDRFVLVSEAGKMYKLQANKFKAGSLNSVGEDLANILNDRIINIFTGNETAEFMFFVAKSGLVKKMVALDIFKLSKNVGTQIMKLDADDKIIDIRLVNKDTKIKYSINDKIKELDTNKFRTKGRNAGGVAGIKLKENQVITLV